MKISIIIPNFNNSKYIESCIKSVLDQTLKEIEVIIIDDGSTDNSIDSINKIINNNNSGINISLIKQYNQNASIARNRGLELAKGEYIYFLDSDDEIYSEDVLKELLINIDGYDLVIGNFKMIDENNNMCVDYINSDHLINTNSVYKYSQIAPVPSNKLYKKSIIKKNNIYFDNVRIGQDLDFYLKYLSKCKKIKSIDQYVYKYKIINTSMSRALNYNFLDIYNTMNLVRKFYINSNLLYEYNEYISAVAINNFSMQFSKIRNYKKLYVRKMIKKYFDFCYKSLKSSGNKSIFYKKSVLKYRIRRLLIVFRIYK